MNKFLLSLAVLISGGIAPVVSAVAAPVVAIGSHYSVFIEGSQSGEATIGNALFDDDPSNSFRAGRALTLTESETRLDPWTSQIIINLSTVGDLFPVQGEHAYLSVDGLDLTTPVSLDAARIIFRNSNDDILFAFTDLERDVSQRLPWDGYFPSPEGVFDLQTGALGVSKITFDFRVRDMSGEIPEPGSAVLGGIALLGMFAARRRNRKIATRV